MTLLNMGGPGSNKSGNGDISRNRIDVCPFPGHSRVSYLQRKQRCEKEERKKRTNRASIQSNQQWRRLRCVEEFCIRSQTAAPKLRLEWLTCYEAKGNLR